MTDVVRQMPIRSANARFQPGHRRAGLARVIIIIWRRCHDPKTRKSVTIREQLLRMCGDTRLWRSLQASS